MTEFENRRDLPNVIAELRQLDSRVDVHLDSQTKQLQEMRRELERQNTVQGLLFIVMAITVMIAIFAIGMALYTLTELDAVTAQLDALGARVTSITAEVRGIGG